MSDFSEYLYYFQVNALFYCHQMSGEYKLIIGLRKGRAVGATAPHSDWWGAETFHTPTLDDILPK